MNGTDEKATVFDKKDWLTTLGGNNSSSEEYESKSESEIEIDQ